MADDTTVDWRHFFDVMTTFMPHLRVIRLPPRPVEWVLSVVEKVPVSKPSMLAADTVRGWNLDLCTPPGLSKSLGVALTHGSVDTGIPAVLDSARPYRWRHPVVDRRPA